MAPPKLQYTILFKFFSKNDKFINSLGKPLSNTKMFVLNESLEEVPPNAIGKLYLSGECVTQGYLNRPSENAKSFIFNKFKKEEGSDSKNLLYNTGDLVRWNKDGNLEYIGRDDFQVKINGLRIDLSEIKNTVLNFEKIQQCAVVVDESDKNLNQKQIIVYYVSKNNEKIDRNPLFDFLSLKLPTFMIPKKIIQIFGHLPLTSNGKLDERVLTKSNSTEVYTNCTTFTPPSNYLEEKLCQIWGDLLDLPKIGIIDDFFALGGDSILVMQLAEQIYNKLQIIISLKDIFIHRCVKNLAEKILHIQKCEIKKEENVSKVGNEESAIFQLLPIQKWFFAKNLKNPHHWNQTFTIKISKALDCEKVQKAIRKLFELHEAFRLRFKETKSGHFQCYASVDTLKGFKMNCLSVKKLGIQKINEIIGSSQMSLNIYNGPLFFVYYLHEFEENESV
jgi:N-(5-amino-5-carboxypentanoyl)-L-cysteinyl-D-valine synthase